MRKNSEKIIREIPTITNSPRIINSDPMAIHLLNKLSQKLRILVQSSSPQLSAYAYLSGFMASKVIPAVNSIIQRNKMSAGLGQLNLERTNFPADAVKDNENLSILVASMQSLINEVPNTVH